MSENGPKNGNAAVYFIDRHAAGPARGKPAFIEAWGAGRTLSYGDLAVESGRIAALYARHGIRREDRAAMLVLDQIEFPIIFWGSLKCGVVPVAINTLLAPAVYDSILRDSRARALFVSQELFPQVAPLIPENPYLDAVFVIGGGAREGWHDFAAELAAGDSAATLPVAPDEQAFWLYSSGSTGEPKGVRHVHGSLQATADTYGAQVLQIAEDDLVFSAAKLFFAYGLGNAMTFPMAVGASTVLLNGRPTPDVAFDILKKHEPTIFCAVPTLYAAMLAANPEAAHFGARLRRCISAGEALPEEVGKNWRALSGTDILDGVGSTEMLHIFLSNAPSDVVYGTSGTAVPGYDLRLVDEAGDEVGVGEIGELLVRGDSAAADYWNQRAKSRATFEGAWTRTGDKYERREDGRLVYCGRTDDMFKVSGIWVSPFEVEQALIAHPAVMEAAVVAARDEDGLEKPKAFVVLLPDAETNGLDDALKEHVKTQVGMWKYPRWIEVVTDLPKTATGKIQRFKLRG
ncbi:MAG: benzoate-CoA ligase family protein [Paracoccaceae bacterium]|nr:benzoate-CoA ligase family protein [Paracoccaceae bacterium]